MIEEQRKQEILQYITKHYRVLQYRFNSVPQTIQSLKNSIARLQELYPIEEEYEYACELLSEYLRRDRHL